MKTILTQHSNIIAAVILVTGILGTSIIHIEANQFERKCSILWTGENAKISQYYALKPDRRALINSMEPSSEALEDIRKSTPKDVLLQRAVGVTWSECAK